MGRASERSVTRSWLLACVLALCCVVTQARTAPQFTSEAASPAVHVALQDTRAARSLQQLPPAPPKGVYMNSDKSYCSTGAVYTERGFPSSPFVLQPFTQVYKKPKEAAAVDTLVNSCNQKLVVYELDVVNVALNLGAGCSKPTEAIGYGGEVPGLTINVEVGTQLFVRFNNKVQVTQRLPRFHPCEGNRTGRPMSVHFHGSASMAPYDGWAEDETCYGESKDYLYPVNRPGTGWYHDHALDITSNNAYYGLAGYILMREPNERWGLQGMEEHLLALTDKSFDADCQWTLKTEGVHMDNHYGDVNLVSGIPFPRFDMEPKWHRFRVLSSAVSRPWKLQVRNATDLSVVSHKRCWVFASDGGYARKPVVFPEEGLFMGVGERYEFACNFRGAENRQFFLWNAYDDKRVKDVPFFCYSHLVARFDIRSTCLSPNCANEFVTAPAEVPTYVDRVITTDDYQNALRMAKNRECTRTFEFGRSNGQWVINGDTWFSKKFAVTDTGSNTWEVWCFKTGGGWFHPIHLHLVDFYVLQRDRGNPYAYEALVPKDVVALDPGAEVAVLARFGPHRGEYMFHCHNLRHEDRAMMRAYMMSNRTRTSGTPYSYLNTVTYSGYAGSYDTKVLYDSYQSAEDPNCSPKPTATASSVREAARKLLDKEVYRLFYPCARDRDILCSDANRWKLAPCAALGK